MGHAGAAAIFAAGGFGAGGGFPPGGGGGACCVGAGICDATGGAEEGGVELVWIGGADRSGALNEGPAIIPVDGAHPFPFVIGNEPGSAVAGLVCPKTRPVCGVGGWLGLLRDNFYVAAMMVRSVVSNNSSTCSVSSSSASVWRSLGVWKLTGRLLRYIQW